MSRSVGRKQTDVKTAYEERLDRVVDKALGYIQDPSNEDKLIKLEDVKNESGEWIVAIGKCRGSNRPFPCVYIEDKQSGRGFTLSVMQMHTTLKAINGLSDEAYSRLGVFIEKALGTRPTRRRREVSEETSEGGGEQ